MCHSAGPASFARAFLGFVCLVSVSALSHGQPARSGFLTGEAHRAWQHWQAAMQAVLERDADLAEREFGQLLDQSPSPLRVALLADRSVQQTAAGGAVLLLEQDKEAGVLGRNGERIMELLEVGRERKYEAEDGWHFCQIGRFDVAQANFRALLDGDPDPVALLELTDEEDIRRVILVQVLDNPTVGRSAAEMLDVLAEGEIAVKADPTRIKRNIERLGGTPRGFENAVSALRDSGEYAVPFLIQYVGDEEFGQLRKPIELALPALGRPAVDPLVMALRMKDPVTKRYVVETLGKIGYWQSVPYLLHLREGKDTPSELIPVIDAALVRILGQSRATLSDGSPAEAFHQLAEGYYANRPSLMADPTLERANVWYWRNGILMNIPVPTEIFNEVMCMRCCEEALRIDPARKETLALWLAANFRRTAQLPIGMTDPTRPDPWPSADYFAEVAGPEACLRALARANEDGDPAVALGTIRALRKTAGPASLLSRAHGHLPLAEALASPNRMVRVQAGLTLGHARPGEPFHGHQNLMPVLSETLLLHGGARNALVIDPDDASANQVAGLLRRQGFDVLTDAHLLAGLQKVREELSSVDLIVLASDIADPELVPGLASMRSDFRFAATPVIVVTKRGDVDEVIELVQADYRLVQVPSDPAGVDVARAVSDVMHAVGAETITPEIGAELAHETTQVLRSLALTNNPVFDVSEAEPALLTALDTDRSDLRLAVVEVLGYLGSTAAQQAIAEIALDTGEPEDARVKMFAALAEAAKRRGNLLPEATVEQIVTIAGDPEQDLVIREAASETLGALNVEGEPASEIIRATYQG